MTRRRIGQLVFLGAVAVALALYGLTVPEGLPWNESTRLAAAYLGGIGGRGAAALPVGLPHPVWGCYVQVFGGAVAMSAFLAALAAGLVGALVNRAVGWRFAAAAAIVWIFLPGVWNRAITGQRSICLAAMALVAVWMAMGIISGLIRKVWRAARGSAPTGAAGGGGQGLTALPGAERQAKRGKVNRLAGWVAIGAAALFAIVSATFHDYRLGEPASAFARGVVDAAGERVIVLNGVVDEQVVREVKSAWCRVPGAGVEKKVGGESRWTAELANSALSTKHSALCTLSLRNTNANRARLATWVRSAFPGETNLWIAATVSPQAFVDVATERFPERFYPMDGTSATREQWERRWEAFKPYLQSSDPFVPVARRLFGREGNAVANALLDSAAWRLYRRVYEEIDPGNFSALVNMSEMIRRGYAASGDERQCVQAALEKVMAGEPDTERLRRLVRASGPVRADAEQLEKLRAEAKARIAARIAAGEKVEIAPEILTLVEWNNEMVRLMEKGEIAAAGRIARMILTNPKWRDFIPANAVLGSVTAREGDYAASAAFFRVATDTTNAVPAVVLNDYADVLMRLGKLDEAERQARRAVESSDERLWVARLTLAQILRRKKAKVKGEDAEIEALLKSVLRRAPAETRTRIRKERWEFRP